MEELKCGDVVCLKSNKSVKMTVRWVEEEYKIHTACCDWFEGGKLFTNTFPVTSLTTDTSTTSI